MVMKYRTLRGSRVLQQLNEVSTEPQLVQNIEQGFPRTQKRQHSTNEVTISDIQYIPFLGTKFLHVKSQSASNGHTYQQALQFMNIAFENAPSDTNVAFTATDGQEYHMQPVELVNHNVKVRCNCLDFFYRFAHWNFGDKSIVGRAPKPYVRKTQNRPPANPDQVPGLCKHLIKLVDEIRGDGLIK